MKTPQECVLMSRASGTRGSFPVGGSASGTETLFFGQGLGDFVCFQSVIGNKSADLISGRGPMKFASLLLWVWPVKFKSRQKVWLIETCWVFIAGVVLRVGRRAELIKS